MPYTIITQPNCPACQKAKRLIEEAGFKYNQVDITEYRNTYIRSMMKFSGMNTVPQIWDEHGSYIGGYEELVDYYDDELR